MKIPAHFSRWARATLVLLGAVLGAGATMTLTYLGELRQFPACAGSTGMLSLFWFCVVGFLVIWLIGYAGSFVIRNREGSESVRNTAG